MISQRSAPEEHHMISQRSAPEEHHVYSLVFLSGSALQRSAMWFGVFNYMPLLTERELLINAEL